MHWNFHIPKIQLIVSHISYCTKTVLDIIGISVVLMDGLEPATFYMYQLAGDSDFDSIHTYTGFFQTLPGENDTVSILYVVCYMLYVVCCIFMLHVACCVLYIASFFFFFELLQE